MAWKKYSIKGNMWSRAGHDLSKCTILFKTLLLKDLSLDSHKVCHMVQKAIYNALMLKGSSSEGLGWKRQPIIIITPNILSAQYKTNKHLQKK